MKSAPSKIVNSPYGQRKLREKKIKMTVIKERKTNLLCIRTNSICRNVNTSNYHSAINYT